ncbi:putative DUF4258 domain-containing protein [Brevibacillus sp. IT-7CA2]|uniref:DUF4258 domain-containing protein n=1 Tax=Brevibacillus sp. IT-7CA2 TaxID=3026436 RepID=UPI0039DF2DA2
MSEDPVSDRVCTICRDRAEAWKLSQERFLGKAENELACFQERYKLKKARLMYSEHAGLRQWQRAFSVSNIREAVIHGFPIYRYYDKKLKEVKIILMSYVKLQAMEYRPMHVVVGFHEQTPDLWTVITVYDPSTEKHWQWNDQFDQKVCFCD